MTPPGFPQAPNRSTMITQRPIITALFSASLALIVATSAQTLALPAHEPRNDAEAALQNKYADKIKPALYQKWTDFVRSKGKEEQVWLHTLEDQLGNFYFPAYLNELFTPRYKKENDAWAYVQDAPALPRVLIIGDSISRAYTASARQALKGRANLHRAPANCGPTTRFLENGEIWLNQNGSNKWDIIIVNFGIHDGKNLKGYEDRLRKVIARLKQTGAKRIFWVRTTPWGKDAGIFDQGEAGDASNLTNPISDKIAREKGLTLIDAHAVLSPMIGTALNRKDFTHWTPEAYEVLGKSVAAGVEPALDSFSHP